MRHLALLAALVLAAPLAAQPGFGFAFAAGADGLVVRSVAPDGAAAGAGIQTDDVITTVGGRAMAGVSLDAAGAHLASFTVPPRSAAFAVRRGGIGFSVLLFPTEYDRVALGGAGPSAPRPAPVPAGAGCVAGNCTDGTGSFRYDSGATYSGGWRGGRRHGQGTFTFTNGFAFVGDWVDGARVRGRESYEDGNAYEGAYADDKRHGQGTMTYADGAVYRGAWAANKRSGQGSITFADGASYVGSWANSAYHGQGRYAFANGAVYEGGYADGKRHGQGRYTYASGSVYDGGWVEGDRHGQGTMTYADGRVESGTWRDNAFVGGAAAPRPAPAASGRAQLVQAFAAAMNRPPENPRVVADGSDLVIRTSSCAARITVSPALRMLPATANDRFKFEGPGIRVGCPEPGRAESERTFYRFDDQAARDRALAAGQALLAGWGGASASSPQTPTASTAGCVSGDCTDGVGMTRYTDGDTYQGAFVGGRRHGRGTYTWASGETVSGDWISGDVVRGVRRYTNGNVYDGEIRNWKRHGEGTMTYADGDVYTGGWAESLRSGTGRYTWTDGAVFEGDYVNDQAHGQGRSVEANGNVYVGAVADGKYHGHGTMTYASGNVYTGDWAENNRSGTGRFTWTNGSVYEGEFTPTGRHGQGTMTYADGRVQTGEWRDDAFVGTTRPRRVTEVLGDG